VLVGTSAPIPGNQMTVFGTGFHSIEVLNNNTIGTGLRARATSNTGATVGVRGEVVSPTNSSVGVYGSAEANTGESYGVWGTTNSNNAGAAGVYGQNGNISTGTGTLTGVRGLVNTTSTGPVARGVFGTVANANANSAGVVGVTTASLGTGVLGEVAAPGAVGVVGRNTSTAAAGQATGVLGSAANTTGTARASAARGVAGAATGASGAAYGVYGEAASAATGVNGAAGVSGFAGSTSGVMGVSGVAANGSAVTGRVPAGGVFGHTTNSNGNAGYFLGRVVIENQSANGSPTSAADPFIVWCQTNGAAGVNNSAQMFANSFNPTSDRDRKEHFRAVDTADVLRRLVDMPLSTWSFKGQDPGVRHMGVMAQDFHGAFALNGDADRTITTTDMDGVLVASVQELHTRLVEQRAMIGELSAELRQVRSELDQSRRPAGANVGWLVLVGAASLAGGAWIARRR
jgi:hypothetical protein